MTTPDTYRELAEEIGRAITEGVHSVLRAAGHEGLSDFALETNIRASSDHWEARLHSALPAVSSLLGELATMRGALRGLYELAGETVEGAKRLGTARAMAEGRIQAARSALAPGSGRLGREVIRAAAEFHLASLAAGGEVIAGTDQSVAEARRRQTAAYARLARACQAILAAHPELGREVEGADDWRRRDFANKVSTGSRGLLEVAEPRRGEAPDGD